MSQNKPNNLAAHIVFCPNNDMPAQIAAGEYIASLAPTAVMLGTVKNTVVPDTATFQEQGFYDTTTGYDNPNSLGKKLDLAVPGTKSYGSVYEMMADTMGQENAAMSMLDALETIGSNPMETLPYYHLVMQLKGTGTPVINADFVGNEDVFFGEEGPLQTAYNRIVDADEALFTSPGGVETYVTAIKGYRVVARQQNAIMRRNIVRHVKKMPSTAQAGDTLVVVTDNAAIYDLRKQSFSNRVTTLTRSFGSLAAQKTFGSNPHKQVLFKPDYPGLVHLDHGLEFTAEKDEELGIVHKVIAARLSMALIKALNVAEHGELLESLFTLISIIDLAKSEQASKELQEVARDTNAFYRNIMSTEERELDEETLTLQRLALAKKLVETLGELAN